MSPAGVVVVTYTALGQLASATLPDGVGTAAYTWGLDGNLASRTWGSSISGTYAYDRAKRPASLTLKFDATTAGVFAREYDRAGNATRESQSLTGAGSGLAGSSIQFFEYDTAYRLWRSYLGVSEDPTKERLYAYDPSGNRRSVTDEVGTFHYFYDATDALIKKGTDPYGLGADTFLYDSLGQLQTSRPSDPDSSTIDTTTYRYDPAGHLVCISTSGDCGTTDTARTFFGIDALGRQASKSVGTAPTTVYAYLGTSAQVSSTVASGALSAYSAIDAIGNRISTGVSGAFGYLIADLHGNVAASISPASTPSYLSAFRYDPYGQTIDTFSGANPVPVPFRYQGRILQSASGATDLYDFGARSYDPSLGTFTSFDSVSGSAQNPLTLNRYLYALANPATLIDPDGHCSINPLDGDSCASQPFKFTWEAGQNIVGFTGGAVYQAPGALSRFGLQTVNGIAALGQAVLGAGQCALNTGCGIHNAQEAWGTFSRDPGGSVGSAWNQAIDGGKKVLSDMAFAGADMADKFEACKARNDYFCLGQESTEVLVNTEGTGLSLIYGAKGLASAVKAAPAVAATVPAAVRSVPGLVKSIPGLVKDSTLAKTISYVRSNGPGQLSDWVRYDLKTLVPNELIIGPGAKGAQRIPAIKFGGGPNAETGYSLPFHGHIGLYNLLKPWLWFKDTPVNK